MPVSTSSGCYVLHNNQIEQWSQSPCGDPSNGVQACCAYGDVCVGNSICHFNWVQPGTSGFYTGGCTNENFAGAACLSQCGTFGGQDITFNYSTGLWACCRGDNGRRDCAIPSNDHKFLAPSPQDLTGSFVASPEGQVANYSSASSTPSVRSPTTTAAPGTPLPPTGSAALPSTPSSTTQATSSGLSGGQKAGIGVGVAIASLALIVLLSWFWWRRRRSRENTGFEAEKPMEDVLGASVNDGLSIGPTGPKELETRSDVMLESKHNFELDSGVKQEADGHPRLKRHELA